jgi:hypothetical protein
MYPIDKGQRAVQRLRQVVKKGVQKRAVWRGAKDTLPLERLKGRKPVNRLPVSLPPIREGRVTEITKICFRVKLSLRHVCDSVRPGRQRQECLIGRPELFKVEIRG